MKVAIIGSEDGGIEYSEMTPDQKEAVTEFYHGREPTENEKSGFYRYHFDDEGRVKYAS